jgi:hypothetical protein
MLDDDVPRLLGITASPQPPLEADPVGGVLSATPTDRFRLLSSEQLVVLPPEVQAAIDQVTSWFFLFCGSRMISFSDRG